MIRKEQLDNWFTYHSPTLQQNQKYLAIRSAGHYFATLVVANTPEGPDQDDAVRKIREAVMSANQAIACEEQHNFTAEAPGANFQASKAPAELPSRSELLHLLRMAEKRIAELEVR